MTAPTAPTLRTEPHTGARHIVFDLPEGSTAEVDEQVMYRVLLDPGRACGVLCHEGSDAYLIEWPLCGPGWTRTYRWLMVKGMEQKTFDARRADDKVLADASRIIVIDMRGSAGWPPHTLQT